MIGTSVQLANKMPDRVLQMWSTGLSNLLNQANGVTDAQLNQSVQLSGLLQQLVEGTYKDRLFACECTAYFVYCIVFMYVFLVVIIALMLLGVFW